MKKFILFLAFLASSPLLGLTSAPSSYSWKNDIIPGYGLTFSLDADNNTQINFVAEIHSPNFQTNITTQETELKHVCINNSKEMLKKGILWLLNSRITQDFDSLQLHLMKISVTQMLSPAIDTVIPIYQSNNPKIIFQSTDMLIDIGISQLISIVIKYGLQKIIKKATSSIELITKLLLVQENNIHGIEIKTGETEI